MKELTKENLSAVSEKHGVYQIYAFDADKNPIHIQRFANKDTSGLIYIGRTHKQGLKARLNNFLYTIREQGKTTNHSGGLKYKQRKIVKEVLGQHVLCFTQETTGDPVEKEKELLSDYAKKFGEYPILNK